MAMELTPTSEVEAINEMLGTIGEAPISDPEGSYSVDVSIARDTLRAVSREVQTRGWWFNEDSDYTFTLDAEGRCVLPNSVLSIRPSRGGSLLVMRRGRVWDRSTNSDTFDAAPTAGSVIWFFDFEDLPESARRYISIRAARLFQTKVLGSEAIHVFTEQHEEDAMAIFLEENTDYIYAEGHNFLNSQEARDIYDY